MSRTRLGWWSSLVLVLGCGDDSSRPGGSGSSCLGCSDAGLAGSGGTAGDGGSAGDAGSSGAGAAGDSGAAGNGGAAGSGPDPECGNGSREGGEACDGADFGDLTCVSLGYSEGALACSDCAIVSDGCSGTEICSDGADNDGDGSVDCGDADCEAACADACSAPTALVDGELTPGAIEGQLAPVASSCAAGGAVGQVIFSYEAPRSGVADVFMDAASAELALSIRSSCDQSDSELTCSATSSETFDQQLSVPVTQGDTLYLVVESPDRAVPSAFQLVASTRELSCGDGYVDDPEECDDGNFSDDDGCSAECIFQPDESEPNNMLQNANTYAAPEFFGEIASADDVDVISFQASAGQTVVVQTLDLGEGSCARFELDNRIEVLDDIGEVIASDDDGGTGFCAALIEGPLGAGTHYVRVRAAGTAERFLYRLTITLED